MTRRTREQYNWDKLEFDETLLTKHFTPMRGRRIEFVVLHHMVIRDDAWNQYSRDTALDACYNIWQTRQASAHYGVNGHSVRQYVWDKDVAWACGNEMGNNRGISIEHANYTLDEPGVDNDYVISEQTLHTSARLVASIHKHYGLVPKRNVTVKMHYEFYPTACPGPYLKRNYDRYFDMVLEYYNTKPDVKPIDTKVSIPEVKEEQMGPRASDEQIAQEVIAGIWGNGLERVDRLRDAGYDPNRIQSLVNARLVKRVMKSEETIADEVIKGKWGNGAVRVQRLLDAGYNPTKIQTLVNQMLGA